VKKFSDLDSFKIPGEGNILKIFWCNFFHRMRFPLLFTRVKEKHKDTSVSSARFAKKKKTE